MRFAIQRHHHRSDIRVNIAQDKGWRRLIRQVVTDITGIAAGIKSHRRRTDTSVNGEIQAGLLSIPCRIGYFHLNGPVTVCQRGFRRIDPVTRSVFGQGLRIAV